MEKMLFYFFPSYFFIRDHSFYALRYSNSITKFFQISPSYLYAFAERNDDPLDSKTPLPRLQLNPIDKWTGG